MNSVDVLRREFIWKILTDKIGDMGIMGESFNQLFKSEVNKTYEMFIEYYDSKTVPKAVGRICSAVQEFITELRHSENSHYACALIMIAEELLHFMTLEHLTPFEDKNDKYLLCLSYCVDDETLFEYMFDIREFNVDKVCEQIIKAQNEM